MSKKTEQEDFMPELGEDERAQALETMQSKYPWDKLYANAPARANKTLSYSLGIWSGMPCTANSQ